MTEDLATARAEVDKGFWALRECLRHVQGKLAECKDDDVRTMWAKVRDTIHAANWRIVAAVDEMGKAEKCQRALDNFGRYQPDDIETEEITWGNQ